jgi:lysozyme
VWTIGYGRTTNVKENDTCTQEQADKWFDEEYNRFKNQVKKLIKVSVNANQLGALTSFAYNCGIGALQTSTLLRKLNSGDFLGASNEFLRWNKAGGKVLAGLTKRREAERNMFLSGNSYKARVTASALNVRAGIGTGYKVVKSLPRGSEVCISETSLGWGKTPDGWIALQYTVKV